ncbi:hypothetical protein [Amycolatopsis rubida]|uniref:Uncharacterized protein n=1 Tax=Amycolatopsis rubida TaxID=112413 RepID=A0A1I5YJE7_9PSEU|nr:hypothetical protein [Amycolatopsis rubida]SFQ44343.1 hypothetical protein SAMN05421854_112138 [Amycolatopsis rubida]
MLIGERPAGWELATVISVTRNFAAVLSGNAHLSAFGAPGEAGDVPRIIHLASRYVAVYQSFLEWSYRLRGYATPSDEAHEVFAALARYADQLVERLRSFVYEFRDRAGVSPVRSRPRSVPAPPAELIPATTAGWPPLR